MTALFAYLARRRWAGVGLAVVAEAAILVPMAYANPSTVVGIPAAAVAAIAGTVAVVFGPFDGALVAFAGALLFGFVGGWSAGEVAALVVWPAIVVAAGLFARRVERQRRAVAEILTTQENERQRIALELHDETAQDLTAALLALKQAERTAIDSDAARAAETSRELIQNTIKSVRELAVELRPKALDDFGLEPAVERLAADVSSRTGTLIDVDVREGEDRLPRGIELTAYRVVQETLVQMAAHGDGRVQIVIDCEPETVRVLIEHEGTGRWPTTTSGQRIGLGSLQERVQLAGGRLSTTSGGSETIRVVLPLAPFESDPRSPRATS